MHIILLLAVLAAGGLDVYRWTDADGVVHFTDRPRAGAERIVIESAPTKPQATPSAPSRAATSAGAAAEPAALGYNVAIESPGQDEVLWNIEGQLDVATAVDPGLQPGHRLRVFLDGSPAATLEPGQTRTRLMNVYRGEHSLRTEVLDQAGTTVAASPVTSFVVRQTSIQNPQNPLAPAQP